MAELSPEDKAVFEVVPRVTSTILDVERYEVNSLLELTKREDSFAVWIVGLSTAAIGGINLIPNFANIPRWEAMCSLIFFVLSIISGAVYRWTLRNHNFEIINATFYKQNHLLAIQSFSPSTASATNLRDKLLRVMDDVRQVNAIMQKEDPNYTELVNKRNRSHWWVSKVQFFPVGMFILGISVLVVVAARHWDAPSKPPELGKQAPKIMQSRP